MSFFFFFCRSPGISILGFPYGLVTFPRGISPNCPSVEQRASTCGVGVNRAIGLHIHVNPSLCMVTELCCWSRTFCFTLSSE